MNMPGLVPAKHAIITDECRINRDEIGALAEALSRLSEEYAKVARGWPIGKGVKIHLILAVERPGKPAVPQPCRWCGRMEVEHGEPAPMFRDEQGRLGRLCPVPGAGSQYYAPVRESK